VIHVVVVSDRDLGAELGGTLLFRRNVERVCVDSADAVFQAAESGRASIVLLDGALDRAPEIALQLRRDPLTRSLSIVALGQTDRSLDLLEAGVNAVLPLPPGADWDDRLERLVHVPSRKVLRFPVSFAVGGGRGQQPFVGRVLNLSVHGLLLESAFPLEVGEDVRLSFDLPQPYGGVRGSGTVVRMAAPERFGIELTSVEEDGRVRIKRFVESPRDR